MQAGILVIILIIANIASTQALGITPSDEGAPKQEAGIHLNPLQHLYQMLKNLFNAVKLLFQPSPKHSPPPPTFPMIHSAADSNFDYVRLALEGDVLRAMEMVDGFGQTTRLFFETVVRNPKLSADKFRFQPPPGVDVIGEQ